MSNIKTESWIIPFQPLTSPSLRLFCFANAGGSPAQFRSWQNLLPKGIEVCPVQLPGQGSRFREQPPVELTSLAKSLVEVFTPYFDVPVAFWGYSMGAVVAYELTQTLKQLGCPGPRHLFVAARRPPHIPPTESPIHMLPEQDFISEIQRRYNGIPAAVLQEPELMALFVPVLRANFEMIETHSDEGTEQLDCPITAFGGSSDPTVNTSAIMAWGELSRGVFQHFIFPGDHFFVQHHQPAILQILSRNLAPLLP